MKKRPLTDLIAQAKERLESLTGAPVSTDDAEEILRTLIAYSRTLLEIHAEIEKECRYAERSTE